MIEDDKILRVKNDLIDKTLLALTAFFLIPTAGSYIRMFYLGFTPVVIFDTLFCIMYVFLYIFRNKFSYRLKMVTVFISILFIAVSAFFSLGLLSLAVPTLMILIVFAALFLERRGMIVSVAVALVIMGIFGWLFSTGKLHASFDVSTYFYSKGAWIYQIITMPVILALLSFSISSMMGSLKKAIRAEVSAREKMEDMLKSENIRLEKLVEERTQNLEMTTRELMKKEKLASLGSLVAGVSHEINTPLGVALTASTHLFDYNKSSTNKITENKFTKQNLVEYLEKVDETSDIISRNLLKAAELVRSFKQISVNQANPVSSRFNLRKYLDSVVLTLKHEYKKTNHKINVAIDEELWIDSIPSAYSQIFTNLIMNSLTHAFNDGRDGLIVISGAVEDSILKLTYSDNGTGIAEEAIPHIFDPFFTTNRGGGGSGLGLNIVYNIITGSLGGSINCLSPPGSGTEFHMVIPLENKGEQVEQIEY